MKICIFWGEPTDISAKKEALVMSPGVRDVPTAANDFVGRFELCLNTHLQTAQFTLLYLVSTGLFTAMLKRPFS